MGKRVDLDAAERVINRPHVIDLRGDGWTIMHPPAPRQPRPVAWTDAERLALAELLGAR